MSTCFAQSSAKRTYLRVQEPTYISHRQASLYPLSDYCSRKRRASPPSPTNTPLSKVFREEDIVYISVQRSADTADLASRLSSDYSSNNISSSASGSIMDQAPIWFTSFANEFRAVNLKTQNSLTDLANRVSALESATNRKSAEEEAKINKIDAHLTALSISKFFRIHAKLQSSVFQLILV